MAFLEEILKIFFWKLFLSISLAFLFRCFATFFLSFPQGSSHRNPINFHRICCIIWRCLDGIWWVIWRFGLWHECIETCDVYMWHLHSVCKRCTSINRCWRLSIDGVLFMSNDDSIRMSIDFDINRVGRMWVSCCELLVSQDPHGIARCGWLRRCHWSMLWWACRSVLIEVCWSMFEVQRRSTPTRSAEAHRAFYFKVSFLQLLLLYHLPEIIIYDSVYVVLRHIIPYPSC